MAYREGLTEAEYHSELAAARAELQGQAQALAQERDALAAQLREAQAAQGSLQEQMQALVRERDGASRRAQALETLVGPGQLTVEQARLIATHPEFAGVDFSDGTQTAELLQRVRAFFTTGPTGPSLAPLGGMGRSLSPVVPHPSYEELGQLSVDQYAKSQHLTVGGNNS